MPCLRDQTQMCWLICSYPDNFVAISAMFPQHIEAGHVKTRHHKDVRILLSERRTDLLQEGPCPCLRYTSVGTCYLCDYNRHQGNITSTCEATQAQTSPQKVKRKVRSPVT